jgi:CHAD domain-containing protein
VTPSSIVAELEIKLGATPWFRLPELEGVAEGVFAEAEPARRVSATYLDTDDLRLTRWGVSLRHRSSDGWTVKLPRTSDGTMLVREEYLFAGDSRRPPTEAVDLVRAFVRNATLQPQVRLRTLRRQTALRDGEGRLVVDVVDDDVAVLDGRRIAARFRELEVETDDESHLPLLELVIARLRENGAGPPDPTPKVVRALGPRASRAPEITVAALPDEATAADIVQRAIAASVDRLIRHDPIVRLDTDPEGVHQARVATRRLRSDLRTFGALLDPEWVRALREELGWLAANLGAVRDDDVLLARMRKRAAQLPDEDRSAAGRVLAGLETSRSSSYAALLSTLRSERYLTLLDRLIEAAHAPALLPAADRAEAAALTSLVRRPLRTLAKQVSALGARPADDELHDVRLRAKRARYAAEAVAPVLGKQARSVARAAAELQEVLGEHQDAVVAEQWLREWLRGSRSVAGAFVAGELAGLERAAAERARARWRKAWKRLSAALPRAWT